MALRTVTPNYQTAESCIRTIAWDIHSAGFVWIKMITWQAHEAFREVTKLC